MPSQQAEKRLRGVQQVPSRHDETVLHGVQKIARTHPHSSKRIKCQPESLPEIKVEPEIKQEPESFTIRRYFGIGE